LQKLQVKDPRFLEGVGDLTFLINIHKLKA
jgi:hypothetical protein